MNQNFAKALYVAGVTTFCTFLACWAVLAHQEGTASSHGVSKVDEEFVKKAAKGGMTEVKLGLLAEQKSTNDSVKKFAQRMVQNHTKANDELKDAAQKANVPLPTDLDPKDEAKYQSLSQLSGEAFDKAYAKEMVRDHQEDVSEFKKESSSGQKLAIKTFAEQTLPTLQEHLQQARQIEQSVFASAVTRGRAAGMPHSQHRRR
jgi:putative membrane protein